MKIVYKCKETGSLFDSVNMKKFNGYKIQIDHNKISKIVEYRDNEELSKIYYRPTLTPIIFKVDYLGHHEERYNNNKVSSLYYKFNDTLYGEYQKYSPDGTLLDKKYFYKGIEVTNDIINFIGYSDDVSNFKYYTFREDEIFNIITKYGHYFRFCYESERESSEFDRITEYCNIL